MKEEFIPYEQALALKELGFDEPCFKVYDNMGFLQEESVMNTCEIECDCILERCLAPLYQQAFRWFREKYNLYSEIKVEDNVMLGEQKYYWLIFGEYRTLEITSWIRCLKDSNGIRYNTYEEAELACLGKLINIVKDGN
jgi:hypothetical protein